MDTGYIYKHSIEIVNIIYYLNFTNTEKFEYFLIFHQGGQIFSIYAHPGKYSISHMWEYFLHEKFRILKGEQNFFPVKSLQRLISILSEIHPNP